MTLLSTLLVVYSLLLPACVSAQGWQKRFYWDSLACTDGRLTEGIFLADPRIPCPPSGAPSTDAASWPCEQKSKLTGSLSSESTTCDAQTPISDAPFFPQNIKFVPAPYLWVTIYTSTDAVAQTKCEINTGKTAVEIRTYAADGKCYADEAGYYFKASCTDKEGQVSMCSNADCSSCSAPVTTSTTCAIGGNSLPTRAWCVSPPGSNVAIPTGSLGSTNSTINPPAGSSSPAASSKSSPTGSPQTSPKSASSGMKLSQQTFFARLVFFIGAALLI